MAPRRGDVPEPCSSRTPCERMREFWDLLLSTEGKLCDRAVILARANQILDCLNWILDYAELGESMGAEGEVRFPSEWYELRDAAEREVRRQIDWFGAPIGGAGPREN